MSTSELQSKRIDDFNALKSILPHWDPSVLASIFQANEYSLELSMQTALSMEEDGNNKQTSDKGTDDKEPSSTISSTSPSSTTVTPVKAAILEESDPKSNKNADNLSNKRAYRGAKFELPDEFLRVSDINSNSDGL